jgi:hypothetical protein
MHVPDDPAHAYMCGDSPNPEDFLSTEEFEERRDDAIELMVNRMIDRDYEDASR